MHIINNFSKLKSFIRTNDWDGLEDFYYKLCLKLADQSITQRIKLVNVSIYQKQIRFHLEEAIRFAKKYKPVAIYLEYNLDNGWDTSIYLCDMYNPENINDEDWAANFINYDAELNNLNWTPEIEFSEIYREEVKSFGNSDYDAGIILFLIARTIAAIGRVSERINFDNIRFCVAFHDQDPILRMNGEEYN